MKYIPAVCCFNVSSSLCLCVLGHRLRGQEQPRSAFRGDWLELELLTFFSGREPLREAHIKRWLLLLFLPLSLKEGISALFLRRERGGVRHPTVVTVIYRQPFQFWHIHIDRHAECKMLHVNQYWRNGPRADMLTYYGTAVLLLSDHQSHWKLTQTFIFIA